MNLRYCTPTMMSRLHCNLCSALLLLIYAASPCSTITLTYTIPEEQEPGFLVGNNSVMVDADFANKYADAGGIPSILRFSLLESTPYFGIDGIRSTIRTKKKLDRELICMDEPNEPCIIEIDVVVGPNTPEHFQMIKVQIAISDINDNSPLFPKPIADQLIPENYPVNSTFYLPTAEDRDSESYGVAEYELEAHTQAFRIRSVPGQFGGTDLLLVLAEPLDREMQGSYTLKLVARDSGTPPRSGMMLLNITVGDENDNVPEFQQPIYSVRVPESAQPNIMLTRVLANDRDSGVNGAVKYSISPRTSAKIRRIFSMDERTGELFLRQRLDFEDDKNFLIPIIATDSSPMPKRAQSVVNISIADENDNSPEITITTVGSRKAQVIEHSPNGTFVAHVRVNDRDSGSNGLVTCLISSPYFLLQQSYQDEYNLVVNAVLDREINSELNITIMCSDGGSPQRVGREYLTISIIDVNDQKPTFDRFVYYTVPILENNELGIPITHVKALDRDVDNNAEVEYQLGTESDASFFSVDRISGLITARAKLDREDHKDYTFSVLAIDKGFPPLTATAAVYIRLADVNDNAPMFNKTHYVMSVAENMPKYSFVGKVTAQDADEGANGEIWYRMVNASSGPFIIAHDTGIISTRVPLDRERVGGSLYQITVVATDYGTPALSSEVKITIDIIDENDNEPMITSKENVTLKVSHQTPINTPIGNITAYDPDSADNGRLGYFIQSGNQYNMFAIDKTSGQIRLIAKVNSTMIGYYRLTVGVHDNGLPPHTVLSQIVIKITKDAYVPASKLVSRKPVEPKESRTYSANLIVVVVLSATSGVLSIILIIAIIRIKRQTKENHTYNCRTEAQKLFNGRSSQHSHPSCGSSWAALSTTDRSSVFSRGSACSENDPDDAPANQTFLTTFSNTSSKKEKAMTALQTFSKSNLDRTSVKDSRVVTAATPNLQRTLLDRAKEPDSDSGNCDDIHSVHNSTPVLTALPQNASQSVPAGAQQSFQYKFLSTAALEEGAESKVPSSISSGNNSLTTNSSHAGSPAIINQNSNTNHKHKDGTIVSAHCSEGRVPTVCLPPPPQESSSDNYPTQNTSDMSDQTINGDRLCAHIDDLFFSGIV